MLVSHDAVPDLTDQVLRADQAVKAELFTADRRLIIAGCSYYWPESVFSCRSAPVLWCRRNRGGRPAFGHRWQCSDGYRTGNGVGLMAARIVRETARCVECRGLHPKQTDCCQDPLSSSGRYRRSARWQMRQAKPAMLTVAEVDMRASFGSRLSMALDNDERAAPAE